MADTHTLPQIENKAELAEWMEKGCKPAENWRIGTEHEKFCFNLDGFGPLPYEGPAGIEALLTEMGKCMHCEPINENGKIIGLKQKAGNATVTLEPGGQLELSGAPLKTLHETCREVNGHLEHAKEAGDKLGVAFLGLGFSPKWKLEEIPLMPKGRYKIMSSYMPKKGNQGLDMMFRSCTVQVNLDFESEANMVKILRTSLALQPIATAIFANSPFTDGKPNGYQSFRSAVWLDTDPDRTGMLPFAFEDGMGFERYVDYALDVPMYFFYVNGQYEDATAGTFRQFMAGEHPTKPGVKPNLQDWENHLTTLFPEVRVKQFLEMRGADGGAWRELCGLPAFWVGLLYDSVALDEAWQLVKDWSEADREQMRNDVPKLGLKAECQGRQFSKIAKDVLAIAEKGLKNRNQENQLCEDERMYLSSVKEIVENERTRSDRLLERFENDWNGDIDEVFRNRAY